MKQTTKKISHIIFILYIFGSLIACQPPRKQYNELYQVSTINALMLGLYDGVIPFGKLKTKGDFGIGTTHRLNGEMIMLNGAAYRIEADGKVYPIMDNDTTPFAVVTHFQSQKTININSPVDLEKLQKKLNSLFVSKNYFYAIRIDGTFKQVKVRSVPAQNKPYPLLTNVVKNQTVFTLDNITGTLAGFWCPAFVSGVNVPGFHFHFISDDRKSGGHVLGLETGQIKINISVIREFKIILPENNEFMNTDFTPNMDREIHTVERGR